MSWDARYGSDVIHRGPAVLPAVTGSPILTEHHRWTRDHSDASFIASDRWRLTKNHVVTSTSSGLEAWSREEGRLAWRTQNPSRIFLTTHHMVFTYREGLLNAYAEQDGSLLWSLDVPGPDVAGPRREGYLAMGSKGILWLAAGSAWDQIADPPFLIGVDTRQGRQKFFYPDALDANGLLITEGDLIFGQRRPATRCIKSNTGEVLWELENQHNLLVASHGVLVTETDGVLAIINARTGETLWTQSVPVAAAAVDRGRLYVASRDWVFRFDVWTGRLEAQWYAFVQPQQLAILGDHLYVGGGHHGTFILDTETLDIQAEMLGGGRTFLTDGQAILLADESRIDYFALPPTLEPGPAVVRRQGFDALGVYELELGLQPDVYYEIRSSDDLTQWLTADLPLRPDASVTLWKDERTKTSARPNRFYRLRPIMP